MKGPNEEREANRSVTRLRTTLIADRARCSNRLKAMLYLHGLIDANDSSMVSNKWIRKVLEIIQNRNYPDGFKYTIQSYAEQWLEITTKIKEIDKKLAEQTNSEGENKLDTIYRSVPGIGPLNARILANELGDMSQFSNEKKLYSFTGLTPREPSSGDKRYLGSISRQGRSVLRKVLVEAAWVAIKKDKNLENIFVTITKKAGMKRAIVGVARRLIGRIRTCIRKGEEYRFAI